MKHIFLDTSVLLAFSRSATGGSAFILQCCEEGLLRGYISEKVISEAKKNAQEDMGIEAVQAMTYIFNQDFLTIIQDTGKDELEKAHRAFDNEKDAPIIATAKHIPHLSYIISLDNGFFKPEVTEYIQPIEVVKPGEFIQRFRSELEK